MSRETLFGYSYMQVSKTTSHTQQHKMDCTRIGVRRFLCVVTVFVLVLVLMVKLVQHNHEHNYEHYDDQLVPGQNHQRQVFVRNMTLDAWNAYAKYAWGADVLHLAHQNRSIAGAQEYLAAIDATTGRTIVAALDTLYLMGLEEQFERAVFWTVANLNFGHHTRAIEVYSSVTELMAALVATHTFTKDHRLLDKVYEIAVALGPAYHTKTGLPYGSIAPNTAQVVLPYPNGLFHPDTDNTTTKSYPTLLGEAGGQRLEYDQWPFKTFRTRVRRIEQTIGKCRIDGLYPHLLDVRDLVPHGPLAAAKSTLTDVGFYSYLIKAFIQSDCSNIAVLHQYIDAIDAVKAKGLLYTASNGHLYARDLLYSTSDPNSSVSWSEHSTTVSSEMCHLGAMFGLTSHAIRKYMTTTSLTLEQQHRWTAISDEYLWMAVNVTETCHWESMKTASGLLPTVIALPCNTCHRRQHSHLTSGQSHTFVTGLAESYFVLHRVTGNDRYRDYAWHLTQALQRHTRSPFGGYLQNVAVNLDRDKSYYAHYATQPSHFISGTLKYLYLIFAPKHDPMSSLDHWVFNSAGHPFPIQGSTY